MFNNKIFLERGSLFNKFKRSNFYLFISIILVLFIISGFFIYNSIVYKTEISDFEVSASVSDIAGISPNTHFIIKTTKPLTSQVIEKYIRIIPNVDFSIKKAFAQENTFEVIPKSDLEINKIYTVQIDKGPLAEHTFSWAYQVKAPFQIISSIPANKGTNVPLNTGIEINFNRENIINPEDFIEIIPTTTGKFETSGNQVHFIPNNPLKEKTVYTVKIKPNLGAKDTKDIFINEEIIQFETTRSYTGSDSSMYFSRKFNEFKPKSDILLGINIYNTPSISSTVYKFNSAQDFIDSVTKIQGDTPWANYYKNIDNNLPIEKKVFSGILVPEGLDYSSFIRLPQALENGYYAVVITSGNNSDISWFQVSPVVSFSVFTNSKSLLWLKDISSGEGIKDASVFFNNKEVGKTGNDGVANFDTPTELIKKTDNIYYNNENNERKFLISKTTRGDLVIPIENEYGYNALIGQKNNWWDYVSLNKNIYLPTDTIRFWAIEKNRHSDTQGDEINVKLTSSYWSEDQKDIITYAETKIKISEYNTITGEMSFNDLKPGTYDLTLRHNNEVVSKQTITIKAYIKPAYKIIINTDKNILFAGDSVTFNVKAEFFDGTPVANTTFSYSTYGASKTDFRNTIKLNQKGEGFFTITPEYYDSYWPSYLSLNIRPTNNEEGQIETNASVLVFGPHINNNINQKQTATGVDFILKTRGIVLDNYIQGEPYWNTEKYLGNPIEGISTKVDIYEVVYTKEQTGTYYDAINKLTYPVYNYKTEDQILSSKTILSDKDGVAQLSFSTPDKKTYKFIFITYDDYGRMIKETRYIYGGYNYTEYNSKNSDYSLYDTENKNSYKVGDLINLKLQTYQGIAPSYGKEKYIFMAINNDTFEYKIQNTPEYLGTFQNKDIPNVSIWSGWFDNERFYNSYLKNISFDANENRLNIKITKDKQNYKPGDEVNLDIKVTDKNNSPVEAEVNLSALDEAVFSLKRDEKDIINDLYRDIYSQVIIRTSNMTPYGGGGAEKGGGDGDSPRSDIQEMAIFKSITTDSKGHANVKFKLPDNITSWRLTSQAVTKKLFAGKNIDFIPVTLPLFVDMTLNNTYLSGDQLVLRLRTFGTNYNQKTINYLIKGPTLPFNEIKVVGKDNVEIPIGKLTIGKHEIIAKVNNDKFSDVLTRTVNVLGSYFTKNTSDFYEGISGLKIKNDTGYTKVSFSSFLRGKLYNELKTLSYEWGIRLDQKGAQMISLNLLNQYFGEKNNNLNFRADKYQNYTGGLKLLPYSSDELELSAISAHLFEKQVFNESLLHKYLSDSLNDKKSDVSRISQALYGLSAFGDPILTKIQSIKNDTNLKLKDKVFIALALDSSGAKEEARSYYKQMIKPYIEIKSSYAYVNGMDSDDTITTTALVAALTVSLEETESTKLALYINQNYPKNTLNNFQHLLYIKSAIQKTEAENIGFTYKIGSKVENKELKNGEIFNLVLSPEELKSFEFSNPKGKIGIISSYEDQSTPESIIKDDNLGINRLYEANNTITNNFNEGDIIKIILNPYFKDNALGGAYQVVDYLPSGLRPIDQEVEEYYYNYGSRIYPIEINDQKVTFMINKDKYINNMSMYYYARVISKGIYKAEPAILQSLQSFDSITISNEDSITIK